MILSMILQISGVLRLVGGIILAAGLAKVAAESDHVNEGSKGGNFEF
jgi:hypothetical protein